MQKTLTTEQERVLADLNARGWNFIASTTKRAWESGQASYIDDRVLRGAPRVRELIRPFKAGNKTATE